MERTHTTPARIATVRSRARSAPRGVVTWTRSPWAGPWAAASGGEISAQPAGAAAFRSGARPVLVRVWRWWTVRPVISWSGHSGEASLFGGRYSAALITAWPSGLRERCSTG